MNEVDPDVVFHAKTNLSHDGPPMDVGTSTRAVGKPQLLVSKITKIHSSAQVHYRHPCVALRLQRLVEIDHTVGAVVATQKR